VKAVRGLYRIASDGLFVAHFLLDDGLVVSTAFPVGFVLGFNLPSPVRTGATLRPCMLSLVGFVSHSLSSNHLLTNDAHETQNGPRPRGSFCSSPCVLLDIFLVFLQNICGVMILRRIR
jgi:hypothetical protein